MGIQPCYPGTRRDSSVDILQRDIIGNFPEKLSINTLKWKAVHEVPLSQMN